MKKLFVLIFIVAMGGLLLTSCGGNGENQNNKMTMRGNQRNGMMMNREKKQNNESVTAENTKDERTYTPNIDNGAVVYNKVCIACHMTGVAGAPALNNKKRWTEIAKKGMKQLHHDAINGFTGNYGVMPPRGTCTGCSDQDLYDAVAFMLQKAGVSAN